MRKKVLGFTVALGTIASAFVLPGVFSADNSVSKESSPLFELIISGDATTKTSNGEMQLKGGVEVQDMAITGPEMTLFSSDEGKTQTQMWVGGGEVIIELSPGMKLRVPAGNVVVKQDRKTKETRISAVQTSDIKKVQSEMKDAGRKQR